MEQFSQHTRDRQSNLPGGGATALFVNKQHLGLPLDPSWGGMAFPWLDPKNPKKKGSTIWSAFEGDTKYFGPGKQTFMLNYRVANLKKVIAALKKEKVWIDPKGIEVSEFGHFAWIKDGEGNRIELWQPPKGC